MKTKPSEILNEAVEMVSCHYEKHGRKTWFLEPLSELRGNEEYFISILNQDMDSVNELHEKLRETFSNIEDGEVSLSLLGLKGHVLKLEHRRSYLVVALAMFGLTIPVWAKLEAMNSLVLVAFTIFSILFMWLLVWRIDSRVFLLKRIAEHLKHMSASK